MPNFKSSFTFIEIIVVVTIIGMLAGIGAVSYAQLNRQSRDTKRRTDMALLKSSLELYKSTNGVYPLSTGSTQGSRTCTWVSSSDNPSGYIPNLAPNYVGQLPADPRGGFTDNSNIFSSNCSTVSWANGKNCTDAAGGIDGRRHYYYCSDGLDYKIVSSCAFEAINWSTLSSSDQNYDPCRPQWGMQVSSSDYARSNW